MRPRKMVVLVLMLLLPQLNDYVPERICLMIHFFSVTLCYLLAYRLIVVVYVVGSTSLITLRSGAVFLVH